MKLFNTFRIKAIETKRLKNYLLYAIGEIVLVVIGILVAVTINNRNENKIAEAHVNKIAEQVKQRMISDIANIKDLRLTLSEDYKIYNLYLKKDKTAKETEYINTQAPFLVTMYVEFLPFNSIVSVSLDKGSFINSILANKLLEIDQNYKTIDQGLKPMEDIIKNELVANILYIKEHFNWYEKLVGNNGNFTADEFKYFNSMDYRNRVVHMKFTYLVAYDEMLNEISEVLSKQLTELNALL